MLMLPSGGDDSLARMISDQLIEFMRDESLMGEYGLPADFFPPVYTTDDIDNFYRDWESLEQLLIVDTAYVPELSMEYMMFYLIQEAIEAGREAEPVPETVPDFELYSDINEWPDILFWDWDFMFLDEMTEEELFAHPMAKTMGIVSPNEKTIEVDGIKVKMRTRPWEAEFKAMLEAEIAEEEAEAEAKAKAEANAEAESDADESEKAEDGEAG